MRQFGCSEISIKGRKVILSAKDLDLAPKIKIRRFCNYYYPSTGRNETLSRVIAKRIYGEVDGKLVSYRDGNPFNVSRDNITLATKGEIMKNRKARTRKNGVKLPKGVVWLENRYVVFIPRDPKKKRLGTFTCPLFAAKQYDDYVKANFPPNTYVNFTDYDSIFKPYKHLIPYKGIYFVGAGKRTPNKWRCEIHIRGRVLKKRFTSANEAAEWRNNIILKYKLQESHSLNDIIDQFPWNHSASYIQLDRNSVKMAKPSKNKIIDLLQYKIDNVRCKPDDKNADIAIVEFLKGDKDKLWHIYEKHKPLFIHVVNKEIGFRCKQWNVRKGLAMSVSDFISEGYLRLAKSIKNGLYEGETFRYYTCSMLRNMVRNYYDRERNKRN